MAKCISNLKKKQSCIRYSKRCKFRPKMRQNAFGGRTRWGSLSAPADPLAAIGGGCLLLRGKEGKGMGKGKEGEGKGKGGRGGEGWKGRTPVSDCESAKVATLKCGGLPTMPEENRGPWSKKFENRCSMRQKSLVGRRNCSKGYFDHIY